MNFWQEFEQWPHFNDDVVSEYLLYAFAAKHHRDNCRNITHKSGQAFYNLSREQMMNLNQQRNSYGNDSKA